jgi:chemotaxis protein MotB
MAGGRRGRGKRKRGGGGHEEEGHSERWMVTYADMLTLLLVLFIVLYAIGSVNTSRYTELKSSLAGAFNSGPTPGLNEGAGLLSGGQLSPPPQEIMPKQIAPVPVSMALTDPKPADAAAQKAAAATQTPAAAADAARAEVDEFMQIEAEIKQSLKARGLDGTAQFAINERGLAVTLITDSLVFSGNSAVLGSEGPLILDAVIPPLRRIDNQIQVDGHTNQQNVTTDPYPSGWELSSARASAVVRYLVSTGPIPASRLSAAGYSDQRPLLPPSDLLSVARNRRVDIVVLSQIPVAERAAMAALGASAH